MRFPKGTPASVIAQAEKDMREGKLGANLDFSKPITKPGLGVNPNVKGTFSGPDKYAVIDPVRPVGTGKPLPAPKPSSISKNPAIVEAIKRDQASAKKPVSVAPPVKKATPTMPTKPAPKAVSKIPPPPPVPDKLSPLYDAPRQPPVPDKLSPLRPPPSQPSKATAPAPKPAPKVPPGKKAGGMIKSSAGKRADGAISKGRTRGRMV